MVVRQPWKPIAFECAVVARPLRTRSRTFSRQPRKMAHVGTGLAAANCFPVSIHHEQVSGANGERAIYRVARKVVAELAYQCVYVEQGKSSRRERGGK